MSWRCCTSRSSGCTTRSSPRRLARRGRCPRAAAARRCWRRRGRPPPASAAARSRWPAPAGAAAASCAAPPRSRPAPGASATTHGAAGRSLRSPPRRPRRVARGRVRGARGHRRPGAELGDEADPADRRGAAARSRRGQREPAARADPAHAAEPATAPVVAARSPPRRRRLRRRPPPAATASLRAGRGRGRSGASGGGAGRPTRPPSPRRGATTAAARSDRWPPGQPRSDRRADRAGRGDRGRRGARARSAAARARQLGATAANQHVGARPGQRPSAPPRARRAATTVKVNPQTVTVAVLNGTTTANLAAAVSDKLSSQGLPAGGYRQRRRPDAWRRRSSATCRRPGAKNDALAVAKALEAQAERGQAGLHRQPERRLQRHPDEVPRPGHRDRRRRPELRRRVSASLPRRTDHEGPAEAAPAHDQAPQDGDHPRPRSRSVGRRRRRPGGGRRRVHRLRQARLGHGGRDRQPRCRSSPATASTASRSCSAAR